MGVYCVEEFIVLRSSPEGLRRWKRSGERSLFQVFCEVGGGTALH